MAEQHDDRIETLARELSALRAEVEALRGCLDDRQAVGKGTMRGQARCPACGAAKILFSSQVKHSAMQHPNAGLCVWQKQPKWGSSAPKPRGVLQVYICMSCMLVEWYVRDIDGIAEAAESQLEVFTPPETDMGPYR